MKFFPSLVVALTVCLPDHSFATDATSLLTKHLDPVLAASAEAVDVVFTSGSFSHLEYLPAAKPAPVRTSSDQLRLQRPDMKKFGRWQNGRDFNARPISPRGYVVMLADSASTVDLSRYRNFRIKGKVEGEWQVALADAYLAKREDNAIIGTFADSSSATMSLDAVSREVDLRKAAQLVFLLKSGKGSLRIEEIEFLPAQATAPRPERHAMWMWDMRPAVAKPEEVVADLRARKIDRIYLQINDDLEPLAPFLASARKAAISIWALDGSPDYADCPDPLFGRVRAVAAFNRRHPQTPFDGFQIDVEPHLKRDFRVRLAYYMQKYVEMLQGIREAAGGKIPVSTVIPFWYDSLEFQERSLAWHVFRYSDTVAIMSYRTTLREIEEISREEIAYGERMNVPVLLGLETAPIPDEEHVVFRRCANAPPSGTTPAASWCRSSSYAVPGSRISFAGKPEDFRSILTLRPIGSSFAGWVIHSYETAPR